MGNLTRTSGHNPDMSGSVRPDIKPDITGFPPKGEPGMSGVPVRSGVWTSGMTQRAHGYRMGDGE